MLNKKDFLKLDWFIDNEYLDKYIEIVNKDESTSKYTERHHIVPKSYFKLKKEKIDNSSTNIVKLTYFNHILAHYYLSLCTIEQLKFSNILAFIMLIDANFELLAISEIDLINNLKEFAKLKEAAKIHKQLECSKLGKKAKTFEHRQALCKARDLHSTTKGKKAIYNVELDCVKFVDPIELQNYLSKGWLLGNRPLSDAAKQKISISNKKALLGKKHQPVPKDKKNSGLVANKVICIETGQIFENINEAKAWLNKVKGIDGSQIKNCCAGVRTTTGGYHWEYYKE